MILKMDKKNLERQIDVHLSTNAIDGVMGLRCLLEDVKEYIYHSMEVSLVKLVLMFLAMTLLFSLSVVMYINGRDGF